MDLTHDATSWEGNGLLGEGRRRLRDWTRQHGPCLPGNWRRPPAVSTDGHNGEVFERAAVRHSKYQVSSLDAVGNRLARRGVAARRALARGASSSGLRANRVDRGTLVGTVAGHARGDVPQSSCCEMKKGRPRACFSVESVRASEMPDLM